MLNDKQMTNPNQRDKITPSLCKSRFSLIWSEVDKAEMTLPLALIWNGRKFVRIVSMMSDFPASQWRGKVNIVTLICGASRWRSALWSPANPKRRNATGESQFVRYFTENPTGKDIFILDLTLWRWEIQPQLIRNYPVLYGSLSLNRWTMFGAMLAKMLFFVLNLRQWQCVTAQV